MEKLIIRDVLIIGSAVISVNDMSHLVISVIGMRYMLQGIAEILHFRTLQTLAHVCCSNVLTRTPTAKASAAIM